MNLADDIDALLGAVGLFAAAGGFWRWGLPRLRARVIRQRSIEEVLLGRPAIPANPITGEPEREAIPGLGDRLQDMNSKQEYLIAKVHENSQLQTQLDRIEQRQQAGDARMDRFEADLVDMKTTLVDTVHSAAEANKHLLPALETAIRATPPPTD